MKLIIGLGNPGPRYKKNRHNVGHMFIDYITLKTVDERPKTPHFSSKLQSEYIDTDINGEKYRLVKVQTYMNNSGEAVKKVIENCKLKIENLIIAHDDLDIPLGDFKIQSGVGPKLHNGLASIEDELGTKDFYRIRIGVDNRTKENWIDGETYVLSDFEEDEQLKMVEAFKNILARLFKNY